MNKNNMKFKCFEAHLGEFQFKIEEDLPGVGWYLYVYKNGVGVADHLQDTLEFVKEDAFEEYGVPLTAWVQIQSVE